MRVDGGHGCLHPWPALGDAPLDAQLAAIAGGRPTNLGLRTLQCCSIDGGARASKQNLFSGLEVPKSHFTAVEADQLSGQLLRELRRNRFDAVKLKAGKNAPAEAERINAFFALCCSGEHPALRMRLDFNASLSAEEYTGFVGLLSDMARKNIDFVEDPTCYDSDEWRQLQCATNLPLALDRGEHRHPKGGAFAVRIWKPACAPPPSINPGERLVVTSYMDHAIGQLFAAYEAAVFPGKVDTCGLLTHPLFEPDPFFDLLKVIDTRLVPPSGRGLGFDGMLAALPWKPLKA